MKAIIVLFFQRAFAPNGLLHGAAVALIIATGRILSPYVQTWFHNWINNIPLPPVASIEGVLWSALKMGILAFVGYITKNGFVGSSQVSQIFQQIEAPVAPPVPGGPGTFPQPEIFQGGKKINP